MTILHMSERAISARECEELRERFRVFYGLLDAPKIQRVNRYYRDTGELVEYDTVFAFGSRVMAIREILEGGRTIYCQLEDRRFINAPNKSAYAKAEEVVLEEFKKEMGWRQ